MTVSFQPNDDFGQITDGLESVSFATRSGKTTSIAGVLRRRALTGEARGLGRRVTKPGVVQSDVFWHLPAAALASPPAPGDTITDSNSVVWTLLQVESQAMGSRWRCLARNFAVTPGQDTLIDIDEAIERKDAHGGPELLWRRWKANVRAKIQPRDHVATSENDVRTGRQTHVVFFQEDLELGPRHRLVDRNGTIYAVLKVEQRESFGELMQAFVEQISPASESP